MVKQTVSITVIILFFSAIMFILGFNIGSATTQVTPNYLEAGELAAESAALEQVFIQTYDNATCEYLQDRQKSLDLELGGIGQTLAQDTIKDQLGEQSFTLLKKKYHLMQIRSYLQLVELLQQCEQYRPIVLFYYDNPDNTFEQLERPDYFQRSIQQGKILDDVVGQIGEQNISVFAIELDYAQEILFLQEFYNITQAPSLVINLGTKIEGLADKQTVLESINGFNN